MPPESGDTSAKPVAGSTRRFGEARPGGTAARRSGQRRGDETKPVGRRKSRGEVLSYGEGRTCAVPLCTTLLSRYNATSHCGAHDAEY